MLVVAFRDELHASISPSSILLYTQELPLVCNCWRAQIPVGKLAQTAPTPIRNGGLSIKKTRDFYLANGCGLMWLKGIHYGLWRKVIDSKYGTRLFYPIEVSDGTFFSFSFFLHLKRSLE